MLKKVLLAGLVGALGVAYAEGEYEYSAQAGLYYTQDYGVMAHDTTGDQKTDFSNIFAYVGFSGLEFDALRFGADLLGSIALSSGGLVEGGVKNYAADGHNSVNGVLYQLYVGYTSDYFDISIGREELDSDFINDFVQGARLAVKFPDAATAISVFYFTHQAVADPNEITDFTRKGRGNIVVNVSNNIWEPLEANLWFLNYNATAQEQAEGFSANAVGLNLNLALGDEESLLSNTLVRYAYFMNKLDETANTDANFLQVEESLGFGFGLDVTLGIIKMFNNKDKAIMDVTTLGDQNPLEQGDLVYASRAFTWYVGAGYNYEDMFNVALLYGNTTGYQGGGWNENITEQRGIHEINLSATYTWSGLEVGFIYSKVMSSAIDKIVGKEGKKMNRDFFEAMVAWSF